MPFNIVQCTFSRIDDCRHDMSYVIVLAYIHYNKRYVEILCKTQPGQCIMARLKWANKLGILKKISSRSHHHVMWWTHKCTWLPKRSTTHIEAYNNEGEKKKRKKRSVHWVTWTVAMTLDISSHVHNVCQHIINFLSFHFIWFVGECCAFVNLFARVRWHPFPVHLSEVQFKFTRTSNDNSFKITC